MAGKVNPPSEYLKNCVNAVEQTVYGRDNRKPIHDVIQYLVDGAADMGTWINDLGLVVEGGKLCVIYDPAGPSDEPYTVPDNVKNALAGILTDVYGSQVRQDIVTSFQWGAENFGEVASIEQSLGLTIQDGKLCVVLGDDEDPSIPADIQAAINRILTDTNGRDLRNDIVKVLRWGITNDWTKKSTETVNDIGLVVIDGKLCIEYYPDEE